MFKELSERVTFDEEMSVLDVGVTADRKCEFSNFFEELYPYPHRITAFSDQDASWMEQKWKGLRFVQGDALELPFQDRTFDLVFSSAVIEHVGSRLKQKKFIAELVRVSRRHVFLTTPNRWFPFEPHSGLPFVHWLPTTVFRWMLNMMGNTYLAQEDNLNLLTPHELLSMVPENTLERTECFSMRFCGMPSNIILNLGVER